jgi:hypothetical protein
MFAQLEYFIVIEDITQPGQLQASLELRLLFDQGVKMSRLGDQDHICCESFGHGEIKIATTPCRSVLIVLPVCVRSILRQTE